MATVYYELNSRLRQFTAKQKMFFVGSAPRDEDGLINTSPKGMDSLCILDSTTVAYLDYTGSGIESVAHIKENGRFAIMFCSFDKSPMIPRLHGQATIFERFAWHWQELQSHLPRRRMARSITKMSITRIADSCGWGVPMYDYVGERDQYRKYAEQIDDVGLRQSQLETT